MYNKISIITVCLNAQRTIEQTIRSVKMQSHQCYEHIFIDGGSKDNTVKIIKKHLNFKMKFFFFPNKGIYAIFVSPMRTHTCAIFCDGGVCCRKLK